MSNRWGVNPEHAEVLVKLEKIIGSSIPLVDEIRWSGVGVEIKEDNVIVLGLNECELITLPESIGNLISLQALYLYGNQLISLPESISNLQSLKILFLYGNQLNSLPESITKLESLQNLDLGQNQLTTLPGSITKLKSLQSLKLSSNQLSSFPESITKLEWLETLELGHNLLTTLPESIIKLKSLRILSIWSNQLTTLPESITKLDWLQTLDLGRTQLTTLPESIAKLKSLQKIKLSNNKLTSLPESVTKLKYLKEIKLDNNKLTTLPDSIIKLKSLQTLDISQNQLTTLPEPITNLKSLQELSIWGNQLTTLPESIGKLTSLQTLALFSNKLTSLPKSMWRLTNLKDIGLEYNPWEGEWSEIAKRDAPAILEFSKQRATINIFISHTVNEFALYKIKELAKYLEHQPEINEVYFCEEDLSGNIDGWMEETVPKSQLLLFIGTQQSKFSKDCTEERRLANINNIPIIPVLGIDIEWKELEFIGLSRELGFEFKEDKFDELCEKIYQYIHGFKRKRDLLSKEQNAIDKSRLEISSLFATKLNSEYYKAIFAENYPKIEELRQKYKSQKITFIEFLRRLTDMLD